jgi:AraC family transcriptional regulator
MSRVAAHERLSARQWHDTFAAPVLTVSRSAGGAYVTRFTDSAPEIQQPALSDHILCLHLGGAKRVRRSLGVPAREYDVDERALTIMPAGQSNRWLTTGPIDFAHLVLETRQLDRIALEEFDRAPGGWELPDAVGLRDPLIERLYIDLLISGARGDPQGRLYPQSLMTVLATRLVGEHALGARGRRRGAPHVGGIADWRLKRVIDFMIDNMATDIDLDDLTAASGLSRAQFFRAFKQSMGVSPHKHLSALRMEKVGALMRISRYGVEDAAAAAGLRTGPRFDSAFRRRFGATPRKIGWR